MVTINNAKITKAEVQSAAEGAGVSKAQLRELASQLAVIASEMKLGDGQALTELSRLLSDAANTLGQVTQQPPGGFNDSGLGSTPQPGR